MINHWANEIDRNCTVFEILLISFAKVGLELRPMSYFKAFTFSLACKYNKKWIQVLAWIRKWIWWNLSLLPVCKLFHHSGECKCPAGFKGMDCEIPCERGRQTKTLWQSCKILLALTIFSKMFLWLQIWDRLRVPVLLLLQELSRLRLGDRRVSVQPGQSWWHVFVKLVTRFVKLVTRFVKLLTRFV